VPHHQQNEYLQRARADRYRDQIAILIHSEQTAGLEVEAKAFEQKHLVGGNCFHAAVPPRSRPRAAPILSPFKKISEDLIVDSLRTCGNGRCWRPRQQDGNREDRR
jgi:hypothetical protein